MNRTKALGLLLTAPFIKLRTDLDQMVDLVESPMDTDQIAQAMGIGNERVYQLVDMGLRAGLIEIC